MPFITEEIWQRLPQEYESIVIAPYPSADETAIDTEAEEEMESIIEIIKSIRNARTEHHIAPAKWLEAVINADKMKPVFESHSEALKVLARVQPLTIIGSMEESPISTDDVAVFICYKGIEAILPKQEIFEPMTERQHLSKEIANCEAEIKRRETKLADAEFVSKAPSVVITRERQRLEKDRNKLEKLMERLNQLRKRE
jgi:valyl-tRNA synthetase